MADHEALGEKIREARTEKGLAVHAAAHRAGISGGYWSEMERLGPNDKAPSVPYLRSVADVLGLDRAELLDLAGYDEHAGYERSGSVSPVASAPTLEDAIRELTATLREVIDAPPLTVLERRRLGR